MTHIYSNKVYIYNYTMNILERVAYAIVMVVSIVYVMTNVFYFFDIGFETYGIYMMFLVAIAILYGILPQESGALFMPK